MARRQTWIVVMVAVAILLAAVLAPIVIDLSVQK